MRDKAKIIPPACKFGPGAHYAVHNGGKIFLKITRNFESFAFP